MFDNLEDCDDVWTQLANHLSKDGHGEVWYWGGKRKVVYRDNFIERWVPDYKRHKPSFTPDVVFSRGGFPQYDIVLERYPKAYRIYYGAGRRFVPQSPFRKYDLILVDTLKQLKKARKSFPKVRSELFIKPAADNVFEPRNQDKKYDVIFSSNEHKAGIKGHDFILPRLPDNLKMIQTGISSPKLRAKYPNVEFTGWIPRRKLPDLYSRSKIAVVCCTNVDSCPRVIPEALACGCPLLVLDSVNLWRDKYINDQTGEIASSEDFVAKMKEMINAHTSYSPYNYYRENLSLEKAAEHIKRIIN
jgi:glycosyltransferase involved in cell wall biosynthesis